MSDQLPEGYRWDHTGEKEYRLVRESDGKVLHWVEMRAGYYEVIWTPGFPSDSYDTLEHAKKAVRKRISQGHSRREGPRC